MMLRNWSRLYSQMTPAELAIEPAVASMGIVYRPQHPVWALGVFADFALMQDRVILEIDDKSHRAPKKKEADAERTRKLRSIGWRVARTTNEEALADPWAAVDRMMADLGLHHRTKRT